MSIITDRDKCMAALAEGMYKRQNYLWLQQGSECDPLYLLPWREVWCESMSPQLAMDLQAGQQTKDLWVFPRQVLSILSEPDKTVTEIFPYDRLMPLYYLNGQTPADGTDRYEQNTDIFRRMNRFSMLKPLRKISRGIFFIAGGTDQQQWDQALEEVFQSRLLADVSSIQVFILGPISSLGIDLDTLAARKQDIFIWEDEVEILVRYLTEQGSLKYTGHEILVGSSIIEVSEYVVGAVGRIDDDYYLVKTQDLEDIHEIDDDLFEKFMADTKPCWKGFAAGLDLNRNYLPLSSHDKKRTPLISKLGSDGFFKKFSLTDVVQRCLDVSVIDSGGNWTITIPAQSGSGITTIMWSTVYKMARMGYPAMILKSDVRTIDYNAITNFLTSINRETQKKQLESGRNSGQEVPVLLVFDTEHQNIALIKQLAALLHNDGRACVVLRAVELNEEHARDIEEHACDIDSDLKARGQEIVCQPLLSSVNNEEIMALRTHLLAIKEQYGLKLRIAEEASWKDYQNKSSIYLPNNRNEMNAESIFWVGLRFFLSEQDWSGDRLETLLMQNMEELYDKDPQMACYLYSIAVATRFRLALPVSVLATAYKIEDWVPFSDDLNSAHNFISYMVREYYQDLPEFLRFRHNAFAVIVMKQLYNLVRDPQRVKPQFFEAPIDFRYPVEWLHHLIANLRAGHDVEQPFGNLVATQVLKLEGSQREKAKYTEQMLEGFRHFSSDFLLQNPTVLQANAITLAKSARNMSYYPQYPMDSVRERFKEATKLMENALGLVESRYFSDEDPRVLKTTLANVYENWARSELERREDIELFYNLVEQAAVYYQEVFSDWPDNSFASFGYSQLLYHRFQAAEMQEDTHLPFEYLQDALVYLDTAKPEVGFRDLWQKHRLAIIKKISEEEYTNKIQELMSDGYEVAYVLHARVILGDESKLTDDTRDEAIEILEQADSCRRPSPSPIPRLILLYRLVTQHPNRRWDFHYRHQLLSSLESQGYHFGAQMLYDYAVLSYQVEQQELGERLFSKLRRMRPLRQLAIEQYEYWRVKESDTIPPVVRQTTMTVEILEGPRGLVSVRGINHGVTFYANHAWGNEMKPGMITTCIIRFGKAGALAIPPHYYREGGE